MLQLLLSPPCGACYELTFWSRFYDFIIIIIVQSITSNDDDKFCPQLSKKALLIPMSNVWCFYHRQQLLL